MSASDNLSQQNWSNFINNKIKLSQQSIIEFSENRANRSKAKIKEKRKKQDIFHRGKKENLFKKSKKRNLKKNIQNSIKIN